MLMNYRKDYNKILNALNKEQIIIINGKGYRELINVLYEVDYFENSVVTVYANEKDDKNEREFLIKTLNKNLNIFEDEINSRKLAFSNLYSNNLCKCISLINVFIRDDKFFMNVYIRSQNFIRNFKYDCETMSILMRIGITAFNLKPGIITVFCANLHKIVHIKTKEHNEKVRLANIGKKRSSETCKKLSNILKGKKGEKCRNWNGGVHIAKNGCFFIYCPQHPNANGNYVTLSRLVIEKEIGRYLLSSEEVHHEDRNPSNNKITNLIVFSNKSAHQRWHNSGVNNVKVKEIIFDGRQII